ncbi:hypothetical protein C0993_007585 [Termitomyces sp. T159_Od127]|nr:hypothetical protein C0993_007585 [Termitomyces sp. T159_Od127]
MTKSEILRAPRKASFSASRLGEGARVLTAALRELLELSVLRRLWGKRVGEDGVSTGAMETRPAMRETRWREDRLRGRGDEGDREDGVQEEVAELGGQGEVERDCKGEEESGGDVVVMRREKELVGVRLEGRVMGDESVYGWRDFWAAAGSQDTGSTGEHGDCNVNVSLLWSFQ